MESYNIDLLPTTNFLNLDGKIEKVIKGKMSEEGEIDGSN